MNEYLTRVSTFLKQELPTKYWTFITVENDKIVIRLNMISRPFNDVYNELQQYIIECIQRVKVRQYDLLISIWTPNQERAFNILK